MKGTKPGGKRKRPDITQERVKELFRYEEGGNLIWLPKEEKTRHDKRRNSLFANKIAGHKHKKIKYMVVKIDGYCELLHRMIFLFHKGYLPAVIDHIDGDIYNNNIDNLREADQQKNSRNCKMRKDSSSGIKGVRWHKRDSCWEVSLGIDGKTKYIGRFCTKEDAEQAIRSARELYHGDFCNHG